MLTKEQLLHIAEKYQTPTYVFDIDVLTQRMRDIRSLSHGTGLCYAVKANPFLVPYIKDDVDRLEVCSPGEFAICERAQVDMKKVVLSGVNKNADDIEHAMLHHENIGFYTVESLLQWELLTNCAKLLQRRISVLPRLTSGNQFGLGTADFERIIETRSEYPQIDIVGIQYFSGTQKKSMENIAKELAHLNDFCDRLYRKHGFSVKEIEYGPGLPIAYFDEEACDQNLSKLESLLEMLLPYEKKFNIVLEMGRYFAATCGSYLSKIVDIKVNDGHGYCIVDGGIHHINYYGQVLASKMPKMDVIKKNSSQSVVEDIQNWTVCGSLCTVNDILLKKFLIQNPKIGDLLVFHNTGAYSVTETSYLFLSREMPLILASFADGGNIKTEVLRERMKTDIINSKQE